MASDAYVEALAFAYADDTRSLSLIGNHLAQQMVGNGLMNGGLNSAPDVMYGLAGDDTFIMSAGSVVIEAAGGGFDTIVISGTYQLPADVYVEVLRAPNPLVQGGAVLVGNAVAQALYGDASANHLNGLGGGDVMVGYAGSDTYIVNDVRDGIVEAAGQGTDTVFASVSYQLTAGAAIESFQAQLAASTAPINLTGNELEQLIYGNAGNNVLNGNGGGNTLYGMGGNDWYIITSSLDVIQESASETDFDAVFTSVNYSLQLSHRIETLSTSDHSATTPIVLVGSSTFQNIIGNAGNDRIAGQGGNDIILGLGGADTFNFTAVQHSILQDFETGIDKIELDNNDFAKSCGGATCRKRIRHRPPGARRGRSHHLPQHRSALLRPQWLRAQHRRFGIDNPIRHDRGGSARQPSRHLRDMRRGTHSPDATLMKSRR